jgi:sortase A
VLVGLFGELLITAGVLVLLLVVYELYITGIYTHAEQHKLEKTITATWKPPVVAPAAPELKETVQPVGQPVAVLHAPRLGADWKWVVVEGVGTSQLAKGPGHYPGTALPGQVGNLVISGHRTTHGAPFFHTDSLQAGDDVIVETPLAWYVYKVTGNEVVKPTDVAVVLPVPRQPGVAPTQKLLTLTTCNPRYSASQRLIIHGVLAGTYPKSGSGAPPPAVQQALQPPGAT